MKKNSILYIVISVLLALLVMSNIGHKNDVDNDIKIAVVKDTVFSHSVDTIFDRKPNVIQTIIRDTIVAKNAVGDSLKLIYESRIYEDSLYKAYISGYNASLDSISIYKHIETKEIFTEVTKVMNKEISGLYLDCGVSKINDCISPNIGISLHLPKGFKIGGEIGTYDKNIYYGIKIGYRIK